MPDRGIDKAIRIRRSPHLQRLAEQEEHPDRRSWQVADCKETEDEDRAGRVRGHSGHREGERA